MGLSPTRLGLRRDRRRLRLLTVTRARFGYSGMIVASVLIAVSAIAVTLFLVTVVAILQGRGLLPLPAPKEDKPPTQHHQ
jgi:hypothetical protein